MKPNTTKRQYVYLAGSMENVCKDTMHGWRDIATLKFNNEDIQVLDPTRRAAAHVKDSDATFNKMHRIVQQDLQDISQSRVILADLRDSQPGAKWGTVMELALAHRDRRVVIVLVDEGQFKHPFVYTMATEVHYDLTEAIDACISYYK